MKKIVKLLTTVSLATCIGVFTPSLIAAETLENKSELMPENINDENVHMEDVDIVAEYAVSVNLDTGEILYGKNEHERARPASITKIMTALLLVENIKPKEEIVISDACSKMERSGSQLIHEEGETLSRDVALYSMMVTSANDIACAIGEHISGSEAEFGELMTKRAKELGAKNTTFETASGLDGENHYTTAYDMALITKEAFKHEIIADAMFKKVFMEKTSLKEKEVTNSNKIQEDEDTLGGKTGYTSKARNTLVKVDEVDGKRVINVIMKTNLANQYTDIKKISNVGISKLERKVIVDNTWEDEVDIFGKNINIQAEEEVWLTTIKNKKSKITTAFQIDKKLNEEKIIKDGIEKGDIIGRIVVKANGEVIKEVNAIAIESQKYDSVAEKANDKNVSIATKAFVAIAAPIIIYVGFVIFYNRHLLSKRKKRKK